MHMLNFSKYCETLSQTLPPVVSNHEYDSLILGFILEITTQNPLQDVLIMYSSVGNRPAWFQRL